MRSDNIIAVAILFTGVAIIMVHLKKSGEITSQLKGGPLVLRWFYDATLAALGVSSILGLGLEIAGISQLPQLTFPWLAGLFMMSYWPFMLRAVVSGRGANVT